MMGINGLDLVYIFAFIFLIGILYCFCKVILSQKPSDDSSGDSKDTVVHKSGSTNNLIVLVGVLIAGIFVVMAFRIDEALNIERSLTSTRDEVDEKLKGVDDRVDNLVDDKLKGVDDRVDNLVDDKLKGVDDRVNDELMVVNKKTSQLETELNIVHALARFNATRIEEFANKEAQLASIDNTNYCRNEKDRIAVTIDPASEISPSELEAHIETTVKMGDQHGCYGESTAIFASIYDNYKNSDNPEILALATQAKLFEGIDYHNLAEEVTTEGDRETYLEMSRKALEVLAAEEYADHKVNASVRYYSVRAQHGLSTVLYEGDSSTQIMQLKSLADKYKEDSLAEIQELLVAIEFSILLLELEAEQTPDTPNNQGNQGNQ